MDTWIENPLNIVSSTLGKLVSCLTRFSDIMIMNMIMTHHASETVQTLIH